MSLQECIQTVCNRVAPTWPLDRFIAVNPYWGYTDRSMEEAASSLMKLCGSPMMMAPGWYEDRLDPQAPWLEMQARQNGLGDAAALLQFCRAQSSRQPTPLALLTTHVDASRNSPGRALVSEVVTQTISHSCATFFDRGQALWGPDAGQSLYAHWLSTTRHDHGITMLTGISGITRFLGQLPEDPAELIAQALAVLQIPESGWEDYLTALLLSINGWAAWCAYLRWQAGLQGQSDDTLEQLLAIRLAWEWLLYERACDEQQRCAWKTRLERDINQTPGTPSPQWAVIQALEHEYQQEVQHRLKAGSLSQTKHQPALQAVFCIDVRSEVMRRALEACDPAIQTLGFAGFFGIPAAYHPLGTHASRPQLPGLLSPAVSIEDTAEQAEALARRRQQRLGRLGQWNAYRSEALSAFNFVESLGLGYAWKLLANSLGWQGAEPLDQSGLKASEYQQIQPVLAGLDAKTSISLAAGVLRAMSLTEGFAPVVLLLGHGSSSRNNPHASGLDCGACCGQTGEVNSRALAALLNSSEVRQGLAALGIDVPPSTRFVAGLHDTTTDDIRLFDLDPSVDREPLRAWLDEASQRARRERAASLGIQESHSSQITRAIRKRSQDWSQVRPEWGLANNAGFLAAPRQRSQGVDLKGRCFLHEYDCHKDPDGTILEQIMTAPLIVAHWINMQYYASMVDPIRFGSGNKVLHNVVGGNLGVFEGNGGDLRIGLALQSLHDGTKWMHTPLRLSAWLEAPQAAIERVLEKHNRLRQLVQGRWIHLLRIEPQTGEVFAYNCSQKQPAWEPRPVHLAQV